MAELADYFQANPPTRQPGLPGYHVHSGNTNPTYCSLCAMQLLLYGSAYFKVANPNSGSFVPGADGPVWVPKLSGASFADEHLVGEREKPLRPRWKWRWTPRGRHHRGTVRAQRRDFYRCRELTS